MSGVSETGATAGDPLDELDGEDLAGLASGRRAVQAKIAGVVTALLSAIAGYLAVDAWYTHRNEQPRANPWEYVPRLRIEAGEVLAIFAVAAVLGLVVHRLLAPRRVKEATEPTGPLDADTGALYGDIRRKSRQATLATVVGGLLGVVAAGATFYGLVELLEPRTAFDLRVLFGAVLAGVLVGGALRQALLPAAMRDEAALDFATLPAGSPESLRQAVSQGFTLSRQASPLDLVGLGSRAQARYEILCGGALAGFVSEAGGPLGALALGGERGFTWIVSDGEQRALHLSKGPFASELQLADAHGRALGRVRRSRIPFVRTLVVELDGQRLRLAKRWLSSRYTVRSSEAELAEARGYETKDDMGLKTRRVDVELTEPAAALAVLVGVLAMDAI